LSVMVAVMAGCDGGELWQGGASCQILDLGKWVGDLKGGF